MKSRFRLIIVPFISCLLLTGVLLSNSHTTIRATSKAKTAPATTAMPPQECAQCENRCKAWADKCSEGGQYACYKAAACLCKCNLDAGGCGSSKEALRECYEQNEKSAKELESPGQQ